MPSKEISARMTRALSRKRLATRGRAAALIVIGMGALTTETGGSVPGHEVDPEFANVRLSTGVDMHYAVQGNPSGQPVILLHGYTDSWLSFSLLLPHIPAPYRAYALDQRGHGESGRSDDGYAIESMAQDVIAFLDAMNIDRATIVGHSMGSFVAQRVALAAPDRVERLVLIASAPTPRSFPGIAAFGQAVNALPDPVPVEFAREFQESTVFRKPPAKFMDDVVSISTALPAHVWRGAMIGMITTDPPVGLAELDIPTLIVWGDRDAVFPEESQKALRTLLPESRFVAYRNIGHAPHWEQPDVVARDVMDFLAWKAVGTP